MHGSRLLRKVSWPTLAIGVTLLGMGCAQIQGAPAMRPHARAAAERSVSEPAPQGTVSAAADVVAEPRSEPRPTTDTGASASWDSRAEPLVDRTPAGWFPPLAGLGAGSVIGRFGDARDGGVRRHEGIDLAAPRGTAVVAPADAEVIASGQRGRAGNLVILLSADGEHELYFMHLERRLVSRGERVRAGQTIGTVGSTGNAAGTTPHLHFEIRRADHPIDPWPLLLEK